MEAHTPKREAIEKFIEHEKGSLKDWVIRAIDEGENPVVVLEAHRGGNKSAGEANKKLEIHTRQVRLEGNELDEATQTMIRRWIASL